MLEKCCLCEALSMNNSKGSKFIWNKILFQSRNFVAIPTIGSTIEGWLLLVPKEHFLCIGALSDNLLIELNSFKELIYKTLSDCYGSIVFFEHGPSKPNQAIGCGVDHAHLHAIPFEYDLATEANKISPVPLKWEAINGFEDLKKFYERKLSYLYVEQKIGEPLVATHPKIPSQLFRRVIAKSVGNQERYNWKKYIEEQNIKATICKIEKYLLKNRELIKRGA